MVITLTDNTDRPVSLQAVLQIPENMSEKDAQAAATKALEAARAANEEEWNYSDIIERLEAQGFVNLKYVEWNEV
jgi:hypothetical protein